MLYLLYQVRPPSWPAALTILLFPFLRKPGHNVSLVVVSLRKIATELMTLLRIWPLHSMKVEASCSELSFVQLDFCVAIQRSANNSPTFCQHGVNKSGAGAARLVKRHQLSPHDPRLFSELSISTLHQNIHSIQGQKMMSMIASANTELSVRLMTLRAICFLCSSSTSSSSP